MPTGVQPWVMPLTTSGSHQKYVYVPGVGVCVGTGTLLSTAGVAPAEVPVGEEEKTEEVDTGHVNWHRDSVTGPLHTFAQSWKNMLPLVVVT